MLKQVFETAARLLRVTREQWLSLHPFLSRFVRAAAGLQLSADNRHTHPASLRECYKLTYIDRSFSFPEGMTGAYERHWSGNWDFHMLWAPMKKVPHDALEKTEGKRRRGQPRMRWLDSLPESLFGGIECPGGWAWRPCREGVEGKCASSQSVILDYILPSTPDMPQ